MVGHRASVIAVLLGSALPCLAAAADPAAAPMQLALAGGLERPPEHLMRQEARADRADRVAMRRNPATGTAAPLPRDSVGQRALQGMLEASESAPMPVADQEAATFRFRKQGNAGRDIQQGYKDMCDRVSRKLWDDPNGKRIKFDVGGKPGVAFEIPLR
jgi:hypothetical protein